MPDRVLITAEAAALVQRLRASHGELLFHQSGGCCDGSAPMCYRTDDFKVGARDLKLGEVAGAAFYVAPALFEYLKHTQLTIDVVPGRGASFSLEIPEGVRFITRSRVFTDEEMAELERIEAPS